MNLKEMIFSILKMKKFLKRLKVYKSIIQIKNKKLAIKRMREIYFHFLKIKKRIVNKMIRKN
jgi:hypothetical protein